MLKYIDSFLDRITMYRLVLYVLIGLLVIAVFFGFFGILPYSPGAILFSTAFLLFASLVTNGIFSRVYGAPANIESVYISALILALIITPSLSVASVPFLFWAAVLAMASKYILAVNRIHIFNPVAVAIALTALWLDDTASWWVGTTVMTPFVLVSGAAIARKIRRGDMVLVFFLVAAITEIFFTGLHGEGAWVTLQTLIFRSSLLFFGFVMLTEPLTTPPTNALQLWYAGLIGFLFAPQIHLESLYSTPELALVVGNIFSYLVSSRQKLTLQITGRIRYGSEVVDFIFKPVAGRLEFVPGQYMEWTLPHTDPDNRGNRRYLTIASSPTEESVHIGVKFHPQGSSFKKAMAELDAQTAIVAGSLAGDFTMPANANTKLVFLAGGIGITPFRSMIRYCIDMDQKRPIVLLYAVKHQEDIAYADVFEQARKLGIQTIYTLTDAQAAPKDWQGKLGRVTPEMLREEVPDFRERTFYLSGPHAMVRGYEIMLKSMGVPQRQVKKDYFPGYA